MMAGNFFNAGGGGGLTLPVASRKDVDFLVQVRKALRTNEMRSPMITDPLLYVSRKSRKI